MNETFAYIRILINIIDYNIVQKKTHIISIEAKQLLDKILHKNLMIKAFSKLRIEENSLNLINSSYRKFITNIGPR